jgi:hypothetical protein
MLENTGLHRADRGCRKNGGAVSLFKLNKYETPGIHLERKTAKVYPLAISISAFYCFGDTPCSLCRLHAFGSKTNRGRVAA